MLTVVDDLPTLPQFLFELGRAIQDESSGASDVAFIMEKDVSLTANVLKLANSAYYGTRGTIGSVQEAIARFGEVGRLVTTLSVVQLFSSKESDFDYHQFWKHILMVGFSARVIAEMSMATNPFTEEVAFVSGLVHDSGVLLINQYFQEEFVQVQAAMESGEMRRHEAEMSVLGLDPWGSRGVSARAMELIRKRDRIGPLASPGGKMPRGICDSNEYDSPSQCAGACRPRTRREQGRSGSARTNGVGQGLAVGGTWNPGWHGTRRTD